ncbi:MAG TPA: hypothetical protein VGE47_11680 [Burkholderiaceae bacterium]
MSSESNVISAPMWRLVFYERRGNRIELDRSGPWTPDKKKAQGWANWFVGLGYFVGVQNQAGAVERLRAGLPG